jgi:sugar phosphate isomerase/epimerase
VPSSPSVQLYSIRDAISNDLQGAVARVAEIGFTKVEPYDFVERVNDYERAFAASGVTAPSAHALVLDEEDPSRAFEAAVQLGIGTVIDPFIPTDRWQTLSDVAWIADRVNERQQQAAAFGLKFGYHNHQWEFANRIDDRPVYELFVERLAPAVVLELDTFWSTVGGADTPALLASLGAQVQFLHIKDGPIAGAIATSLPSSESALDVPDDLATAFDSQLPAGSGDVNVAAILAAAPHALRVVEFDGYDGDVFQGIAASLAYLESNDK